jgi:hypothetical protein
MNEKKRYAPPDAMVLPRYSGIRTFMRLPHVTDLTDVDFAIVGVLLALALGLPAGRHAPRHLARP